MDIPAEWKRVIDESCNAEIKAIAIHDYHSTDKKQLSFKRGDRYVGHVTMMRNDRVILRNGSLKNGWWLGSTGLTTGWVPAPYVKEDKKEAPRRKGKYQDSSFQMNQ